MRIVKIKENAEECLWYKTLAKDSLRMLEVPLLIEIGEIEGLPSSLDAMIIASDLQGIAVSNEKEVLLGEAVAEILPLYLAGFRIRSQKNRNYLMWRLICLS